MATYYVNGEIGIDDSEGINERHPWRSIAQVNRTVFCPGDRILFAGGQTFAGTILLDSNNNGTAKQKVEITSYGEGRATIDGGNGSCLVADGCENIVVRELNFLGSGRKTGNMEHGIKLLNTRDVMVTHVEVSGFCHAGIVMCGDKRSRVTHVYAVAVK